MLEMELNLSLQTRIVMNHQSLCVLWVLIFLVSTQMQTCKSVNIINIKTKNDRNTLSPPSLCLLPVSGLATQ